MTEITAEQKIAQLTQRKERLQEMITKIDESIAEIQA